jgi:hypothetical protein
MINYNPPVTVINVKIEKKEQKRNLANMFASLILQTINQICIHSTSHVILTVSHHDICRNGISIAMAKAW